MTFDEEVYFAHLKIRTWYLRSVKQYRSELPWHLLKQVLPKLEEVMERANRHHKYGNLKQLKQMAVDDIMYMNLPWDVVIYLAEQKKSKT